MKEDGLLMDMFATIIRAQDRKMNRESNRAKGLKPGSEAVVKEYVVENPKIPRKK